MRRAAASGEVAVAPGGDVAVAGGGDEAVGGAVAVGGGDEVVVAARGDGRSPGGSGGRATGASREAPPVVLDAGVRRYDRGRVLVGASGRIVRLTDAGAAALDALLAGATTTPALARRLVDAGLAHPVPPPAHPEATIVVPVHDRPEDLDRCLAALAHAPRGGGGDAPGGGGEGAVRRGGAAPRVIVVDDGSRDPGAIAGVCDRRAAEVLRRGVAGGPGAARNHALPYVDSELVVFLDSDCVPPPEWIDALAGHFDDPWVAAVAPRVVDPALDMGVHPASVEPGGRVPYVPSAALVVRRAALGGFDEALRYGEDVDLVWRLYDGGWRIRYDPRVRVAHAARNLTVRRFRYGTSAAALAQRHPGRLAPVVLAPFPTAILALLAARRPRAAAAVFAIQTALLARTTNRLRLPARLAPLWTARAVIHTAAGLVRGHPAYRAGVLAGAIRHRTAEPLTPQLKLARPAAIRSAPRR